MKMQTTKLLSTISASEMINLTTDVKETFDGNYKKSGTRILSISDLWNIQRQRKARANRRYM